MATPKAGSGVTWTISAVPTATVSHTKVSVPMPKKGSPAAIAYLEQRIAYDKDPNRGPNPPKPPNAEVAQELTLSLAQMMATLLDRILTGETHIDNPCPEAILATAEMMDRAVDGTLTPDECGEVLRRFGWKGEC